MNLQFLKSLVVCNMAAVLLWMFIMLLLLLFRKKEAASRNTFSPGLLLFMLLYIASIFSITIVPLPFSTHRRASQHDFNFTPIVHTLKMVTYPFRHNRMALLPDILQNVFGNILMFIPFGLLLPLIHRRFRAWGSTIMMAVLFSMAIEATQWIWRRFGNYRHVDVDDVILNTLGAIIGFGIFTLIWKLVKFQQGREQWHAA
jgi:glycopeptide antibiotics resistance protein